MKTAILVVSFGTTYEDTWHKTIEAIEQKIREKYEPEYDIFTAYTSRTVIRRLKERGWQLDNEEEAMARLAAAGYQKVAVLPTHLIAGHEYHKLAEHVMAYQDRFERLVIGKPLLGSDADRRRVVQAALEELTYGQEEALVLMGHGTDHAINQIYLTMDALFKEAGHPQVVVGTVEANPDVIDVLTQVQALPVKRVCLAPLLLVAGDHAVNDMAGSEPGSWKSRFEAAGYPVRTVLRGLGEYASVQAVYQAHLQELLEELHG